jgi:hypothetical protein
MEKKLAREILAIFATVVLSCLIGIAAYFVIYKTNPDRWYISISETNMSMFKPEPENFITTDSTSEVINDTERNHIIEEAYKQNMSQSVEVINKPSFRIDKNVDTPGLREFKAKNAKQEAIDVFKYSLIILLSLRYLVLVLGWAIKNAK